LLAALLVVLGCVVAGCGSGPPVPADRGAPTVPDSSARAVPASSGRAVPGGGGCSGPAELAAGSGVAAWRLGAFRFVSVRDGVAVTAPQVPCDRSLGTMGIEVSWQAQPVLLAVTTDGGRHWVTRGRPLPGTGSGTGTGSEASMQVAAVDGAAVWVVGPSGAMFVTRDDGATWTRAPLQVPVLAAASAGGWLWELSCQAVSGQAVPGLACPPVVERMRLPGGAWTRSDVPVPGGVRDASLTVVSGQDAVLAVSGVHPALLSTGDGGARWTVHPTPTDPGFWCSADFTGTFAASGPDDWWLLCPGGAAAGSSSKALMRSADAGRTWTVVASVTLSGPRRAGSLPYQNGAEIAASPAGRLWIVTPNTLNVSTDGGARWTQAAFNPGGYLAFGRFDVLPGTVAWLLATGAGLWQTIDGTTWRAIGGGAPGQ